MSLATAVVLIVLIMTLFLSVGATLVALSLVRGWVEVRRLDTHAPTSAPTRRPARAEQASANGVASHHPMFDAN